MRRIVFCIAAALLILAVFLAVGADPAGSGYPRISQETAKEMMTREDGHVIVVVRRQDEYEAAHIPGAILIPNETIGSEAPEALPDPDQIILI